MKKVETSLRSAYEHPFDMYEGCNHGCIYCHHRENSIHDIKVIDGWEELLNQKIDTNKKGSIVSFGETFEPYNLKEKELGNMRSALTCFVENGVAVSIRTKSDLILRDIELLKSIQENASLMIKMSITSVDDEMSKLIEPRAPFSSVRFSTLKKLSDASLFCGILFMPVLPFVEDSEENIIAMVRKGATCGVNFIYPYFGVDLQGEKRERFLNEIDQIFPMIRSRYERAYANQSHCRSLNDEYLYEIFCEECEKYGILYKIDDILSASQNWVKY